MSIQETLAEAVRQHRFFDDGQGDEYCPYEADRAQLLITILTQFVGESVYNKYSADDLRAFLRGCHFSNEVIDLLVSDSDHWAIY